MVAPPASSPALHAVLFRGLADASRLSCLFAVRDGNEASKPVPSCGTKAKRLTGS